MNDQDLEVLSTDRKPFVILCYPRTGSNLLVDLLNQFPEIVCYGEIFTEDSLSLPDSVREKIGYDLKMRNNDPLGFIKRVYENNPAKCTGFKIFPNHNTAALHWAMKSTAIRRVSLIRQPFDIFVSLERAKSTGTWIDREGTVTITPPKIKFDPDQFDLAISYIRFHNMRQKRLATMDPESTMLLSYADVLNKEKIRQLGGFLGVTIQPDQIKIRLHKQTKEKYSEIFDDFQAVMDHVQKKHPNMWIDPKKI